MSEKPIGYETLRLIDEWLTQGIHALQIKIIETIESDSLSDEERVKAECEGLALLGFHEVQKTLITYMGCIDRHKKENKPVTIKELHLSLVEEETQKQAD